MRVTWFSQSFAPAVLPEFLHAVASTGDASAAAFDARPTPQICLVKAFIVLWRDEHPSMQTGGLLNSLLNSGENLADESHNFRCPYRHTSLQRN
jgi:hypothetical protein